MSNTKGINRRSFFKTSTTAAIGAGVLGHINFLNANDVISEQKESPYKIKEYRTLGRTGFKVSDISAGFVKNTAVLEKLLDAGVNYIDTAEAYGNQPEIGQVLQKRDRKKIFITSKLEIKKDTSKEGFIKRFNKCLSELKTNYIDCMMAHGVESLEVMKTPGFHAAMDQMKKEGKLRHVGISNHGSNFYFKEKMPMKDLLIAAAQDGRFDVILLAYNFIQEDGGAEVLKVLKDKNIGATLMKVNPIGNISRIKSYIAKEKKEGREAKPIYKEFLTRLEEKQKKAEAFIQMYQLDDEKRMLNAAIRFCLENKNVHSICCGFQNFDSLDTFLPLSGTHLSDMEKKKLSAYKQGPAQLYCRHACGECEQSCPQKVQVNSIMRFNHYYTAQGKEKFALAHYKRLEQKADGCANCNGHCEKACPFGVPIQGLLNLAHNNLTLA